MEGLNGCVHGTTCVNLQPDYKCDCHDNYLPIAGNPYTCGGKGCMLYFKLVLYLPHALSNVCVYIMLK